MGRIVQRTITINEIEYTGEDLKKLKERSDRRNRFPEPTKDMLQFCKRLNPCPICGKTPEPSVVGEYGDWEIKMNCSGDTLHISCGNWYKSLARAGKGWNSRTRDAAQIEADTRFEKLMAEKRDQPAEGEK